MRKRPDKKPTKGLAAGGKDLGAGAFDELEVSGRKIKKALSKKEMQKLIAEIGERKGTLKEVADEYFEQTGNTISQPKVSDILKKEWGRNYESKKTKMKIRKTKTRKWKKEFNNARSGIADVFHEDYISSNDGMLYDIEEGTLGSIDWSDPSIKWKGKDIIHFSREKLFGYTPNPVFC